MSIADVCRDARFFLGLARELPEVFPFLFFQAGGICYDIGIAGPKLPYAYRPGFEEERCQTPFCALDCLKI